MVVGDGKPFISALVTLDPEGLENWCSERGLPARSIREAAGDPQVAAAVQEAVDQANLLVSKAESIRKIAVLDAEFTVESGHLTPSLKVKRNTVVRDFEAEIGKLYN